MNSTFTLCVLAAIYVALKFKDFMDVDVPTDGPIVSPVAELATRVTALESLVQSLVEDRGEVPPVTPIEEEA